MNGGGRSKGPKRTRDVKKAGEIRGGEVMDDFEDINEELEINQYLNGSYWSS